MLLVAAACATTAWAGAGPLVQVSNTSPFANCTADDVEAAGTNFLTAVEPWIVVNQ
jgi:hypothetical protein